MQVMREDAVPTEKLAEREPTVDRVPDEVAAFGDTFVTLLRSAGKTRTQFLAAAKHDVEWTANVIIGCVINDGPLRASAIAEMLPADPSTISRQVAALVRDGLLERRADPVDGRASLLVATAKGEAAYRDIKD